MSENVDDLAVAKAEAKRAIRMAAAGVMAVHRVRTDQRTQQLRSQAAEANRLAAETARTQVAAERQSEITR